MSLEPRSILQRENLVSENVKVFSGVYLGEPEELTQSTRRSIPIKDVYKVQALFNELDDEPRWLVALISDTGMRLSEAAGLIVEDIKLDHTVATTSLETAEDARW